MPVADDSSRSSPGRLIAERYRLETKLGEGAMGTVWSGVDELLRRAIAVKEVRLPAGMPEEEAAELRERALREARAIAVVTHPNVVTLYDVAREEGEPFVVMELVPSQSLAAILGEHGALDDTQLALIADGVSAALEAAHRNGIVHRDVKPGNVLIGDDGRIKLSDFGISRNVAEKTITRTGIMLGTPAFIAPEIASGDPVTDAADLWGLGATLFAASEGRPPYNAADDPLATITSVVQGPVPVPAREGPIGEVIAGLMVKAPDQRMPPHEIRRRIQHLLPEPGSRPFDMLLDPDAPTVRVRKPAKSSATRHELPREEPPPLAADPGPLPFIPQEQPVRRSSAWAGVALGICAVLVFVAATAGGYAAARLIIAGSLFPETGESSAPPEPPGAHFRLVEVTDDAGHESAPDNGQFRITVPEGWTTFHEEQGEPTNNLAVSYVSEDGRSQITVQRFGRFFERGYTLDDYVGHVSERSDHRDFAEGRTLKLDSPDPYSGEPAVEWTYTTSETGFREDGDVLKRTTSEQIMPRGVDLWIVRMTVPEEDADFGRMMFDRLVPSFVTMAS